MSSTYIQGGSANPKETPKNATDSSTAGNEPRKYSTLKSGASDTQPEVPTTEEQMASGTAQVNYHTRKLCIII